MPSERFAKTNTPGYADKSHADVPRPSKLLAGRNPAVREGKSVRPLKFDVHDEKPRRPLIHWPSMRRRLSVHDT